MSERRIFTGKQPTVFLTGGVGQVAPGEEFDVPDEHLAAFDARPDVDTPPARRGGRKIGAGQGAPTGLEESSMLAGSEGT